MRLGAPEPVALQFLTLFCAGGVVLQLLTGYMIDRFAPSLVLVICCGLLAAGLALVAQVWEIPLLAWPLMLLMGGVAAAIDTAGLAGINDTFAPAEMPSGTAAFSVLWYVGGLTGPVLAGSAMEAWSPPWDAGRGRRRLPRPRSGECGDTHECAPRPHAVAAGPLTRLNARLCRGRSRLIGWARQPGNFPCSHCRRTPGSLFEESKHSGPRA